MSPRPVAMAGLVLLALLGAGILVSTFESRADGPAVALNSVAASDDPPDALDVDDASATSRPDIVMVLLDDVGENDLFDSYDLPPLHEISKLETNGVRLDGYYGQSYCSPARATLLSGKFAHRIGFSDEAGGKRELTAYSNWSLPLGHVLLPEEMKRLGYATHGVGKWNIGHCNAAYMPWSRGFDSWIGYFTDGIGYADHLADQQSSYVLDDVGYDLYDMAVYDKATRQTTNGSAYRGTYTTELFNNEAQRILEGEDSSAPLFLWLAHHGMHDNTGVVDAETCVQGGDDDGTLFTIMSELTMARFRFACGLRAIDRGVGSVKTALDDRPRDYLLVLISDNGGYACGVHCAGSSYPRKGAKFFDFEGGVKVPGLVYSPTLLPAKRRGQTFKGLMHHVDWLATFMEVAGGHQTALDPNVDSVSQWQHLTGAETGSARDTIIFAASADTATIRAGDYKFMYRTVNTTVFPLGFNGTESTDSSTCDGGQQLTFLYNVRTDPYEETDLVDKPKYADIKDELQAIWQKAYDTEFWKPNAPNVYGDPMSNDAAVEAFHKNGGYVTHWNCEPIWGNL